MTTTESSHPAQIGRAGQKRFPQEDETDSSVMHNWERQTQQLTEPPHGVLWQERPSGSH